MGLGAGHAALRWPRLEESHRHIQEVARVACVSSWRASAVRVPRLTLPPVTNCNCNRNQFHLLVFEFQLHQEGRLVLILFVQLGKTSTRSTITITPKEFYTYYAYTLIVPVLPRQELQGPQPRYC